VLGAERFLREIETAARLNHPNILPLHDSGEADGFAYYVMPYVEGESLRDRLDRETQLPLDEAMQIAREVADALAYAHSHDVVHRDIKPENILMGAGHAVVSDFGIARAISAAGGEKLTETGLAVGTPAYMSPEQLAGGEHLDGRTDVYSLGCVLYEMLAGEPPFTGPTAQAIQARKLTDPVPRLRTVRETVPDALDHAIRVALARNPADRFATAHQFAEALQRVRAVGAVAPTPRRRAARTVAVAATVVLLAAGIWWALNTFRARRPGGAGARAASLAVLPLDNFTGDSSQEYFVDGMTEALIADLSKISALRVISRRSVMQYKAVNKPLPEIATALHVGFVVEGSVVRVGDRVRITAQLIEAATDRHLWSETYDRDLKDVLALQSEVARAIAHAVNITLTPQEQARLGAAHPINPAAHEAYLLGRYFWNKRTAEGLTKAFTYFQEAISKDSSYAAAYAGLADYYNVLPFYTRHSPAEEFPQAKAAARKALEIDETLAEAHASMAYITAYYDWDLHGAEREFQRALELNPSNAAAHHSYSRLLVAMGRVDDALAEIERSAALDPVSPILKANTAMILYFGRRYDEAIEQLHGTLELDSSFDVAQWGLGLAYEQKGLYPQAITIMEKAVALSERDANALGSLGHLYAIAGRRRAAEQIIAELQEQAKSNYVSSYHVGLVYAGLGEPDQAMSWLRRAADERSTLLVYLRMDPRLATLHSDRRFQALTRQVGLPE
jgi:serine/threonine-protein kinase